MVRVRGRAVDAGAVGQTLANLVPLVGILLWGWDAFNLVVLYWLEIGATAGIGLLSIALLGAPTDEDDNSIVEKLLIRGQLVVGLGLVYAFLLGIYWAMISGIANTLLSGYDQSSVWVATRAVELGVVGFVVSHLLGVGSAVLGGTDAVETNTKSMVRGSLRSLVVMHSVLAFGTFGVIALGSPLPLLVLLVAIKTAADAGRLLDDGEDDADGESDAEDGSGATADTDGLFTPAETDESEPSGTQ